MQSTVQHKESLRKTQFATRFGLRAMYFSAMSAADPPARTPSLKVSVVTLGCDKNTVDSERYVAQLADRGAEYTADMAEADVVLVNTCGFIDAAKKESIDALVEAGRLKETGSVKAVVGVGCMVQRHKDELIDALPEVDLFLGSSEMDRLIPELEERGLIGADNVPAVHPGVRMFAGGLPHVRYLKISEGCDHGCAFCAIPLMRGKHRSFALDEIIHEAQLLEAQGALEINLVAQDLAHYGRDRRDQKIGLPEVLEALVRETTIPWIRMLYLYSAGLTHRLLEIMATEPRVLPYLDMPIQHASDEVLARMRRPERQRTIREKVARIRAAVPDVAIRTTCIVGFPGETDDDFETLLGFLEEIQFDRVGAFTYSPQEGTRAAELRDDVPESVKRARLERLNETQRLITAERYEQRIGRVVRALVDRVDDEMGVQARTKWQADDIDGVTLVTNAAGVPPGSFIDVQLDAVVDDVDFAASLVSVASQPPTRAKPLRSLPVMQSIGSYGR
jgi:ribosomal protein S12 methylthiotransferase